MSTHSLQVHLHHIKANVARQATKLMSQTGPGSPGPSESTALRAGGVSEQNPGLILRPAGVVSSPLSDIVSPP